MIFSLVIILFIFLLALNAQVMISFIHFIGFNIIFNLLFIIVTQTKKDVFIH